MSFKHGPLVGIGIFYLAIKFQMLNRCRVVKWLTVIHQLILEYIKYTVQENVLVIADQKSSNFVSPVLFNLHME